jgi:hypothetical protein
MLAHGLMESIQIVMQLPEWSLQILGYRAVQTLAFKRSAQ